MSRLATSVRLSPSAEALGHELAARVGLAFRVWLRAELRAEAQARHLRPSREPARPEIRRPIGLRLSVSEAALLALLAAQDGQSAGAWLETTIRRRARQEGVRLKETP